MTYEKYTPVLLYKSESSRASKLYGCVQMHHVCIMGLNLKQLSAHQHAFLFHARNGHRKAVRTDETLLFYISCIMRNTKSKAQISCTVTKQLISAFVFTTLNPKFQSTNHLLWLYSPVCFRPGWKLKRQVFWRPAHMIKLTDTSPFYNSPRGCSMPLPSTIIT